MHRFFVQSAELNASRFKTTDKDLCHQISKVLKMRAGKQIILCDNTEQEHLAKWTLVSKSDCEAEVLEKTAKADISAEKPVHMYCALLKNQNRWEDMLEKCAELGIASFTPLTTERTEAQSLRKPERLQRIIQEAAELSGRTKLPTLHEPKTLQDILEEPPEGTSLIPTLLPQTKPISEASLKYPINLFIGPVGDFTETEVEQATTKGFQPITLGSQVLRTETAAIVGSSLILR